MRIAGDGSKIFALQKGFIEAQSIQAGDEVGEVVGAEGPYDPTPLIVRDSKVEYGDKDHRGWG